MPSFRNYPLSLLNPSFDSPVVDSMEALGYLRRIPLMGTTPPLIFQQIKYVFHILESLSSARIEGNHTTLADYVDSRLSQDPVTTDQQMEIANIEKAMTYIEEAAKTKDFIDERFIRELHVMTVDGLKREGDKTPGAYRDGQVWIAQSEHLPPPPVLVPVLMRELLDFMTDIHPPKYDLMKIALAHHRFCWIHPFSNGNGRVVRLLTYGFLIKYGFKVDAGGRILNPAAVFCQNRDSYYSMLSRADTGTSAGLEEWCTYVLQNLRVEMEKVDNLADFDYVRDKILHPALIISRHRQWITSEEAAILSLTLKKNYTDGIKSADMETVMPEKKLAQRTYQIKKMLDAGLLLPIREGGRTYTIGFTNNHLLRGIIASLRKQGFIPDSL